MQSGNGSLPTDVVSLLRALKNEKNNVTASKGRYIDHDSFNTPSRRRYLDLAITYGAVLDVSEPGREAYTLNDIGKPDEVVREEMRGKPLTRVSGVCVKDPPLPPRERCGPSDPFDTAAEERAERRAARERHEREGPWHGRGY